MNLNVSVDVPKSTSLSGTSTNRRNQLLLSSDLRHRDLSICPNCGGYPPSRQSGTPWQRLDLVKDDAGLMSLAEEISEGDAAEQFVLRYSRLLPNALKGGDNRLIVAFLECRRRGG